MEAILKAYLEAYFLKVLREGIDEGEGGEEGEGKFGLVPLSLDPNSLLHQPQVSYAERAPGPSSHPLLSRSQQFSGAAPRLTANPAENETAQELYPQLRQRPSLNYQKRRSPPRLVRS